MRPRRVQYTTTEQAFCLSDVERVSCQKASPPTGEIRRGPPDIPIARRIVPVQTRQRWTNSTNDTDEPDERLIPRMDVSIEADHEY